MNRENPFSRVIISTLSKAINEEHPSSHRHKMLPHAMMAIGAAIAAFVVVGAIHTPAANAATLCVDPAGGACSTTIKAAITAANNGDTIDIHAGKYTENLTITKILNLVGAGADTTIIDGNSIYRVIGITSTNASLSNLTVQNGKLYGGGQGFVSGSGAGIYAVGGLTLTNVNVFSNTSNQEFGGGLYSNAALTIINAQFSANTARSGGGIYLKTGPGKIVNSLFARNILSPTTGNGAAVFFAGSAEMMFTTVSSPTIGSLSALYVNFNGGIIRITNTIVSSYTTGIGWSAGTFSSDYNLFYKAPSAIVTGSHSITGVAPVFINQTGGNYHLGAGSPAIDKGVDMTAVSTDFDSDPRPLGLKSDIGYDEATANGLAIDKSTLSTLVKPGDHITYTLTITNGGPAPATLVRVTDTVPSELISLTYSASGVTITPTGASSYVFQVSTMAANSTGTITIVGVVDPALTTGARITNTASVGSSAATTTPSASAGGVDIVIPPTGLTAINDSPTQLGSTTYLTATITGGLNVTYTWDLGDGDVAYGANVSDIYTAVGVYTATVTASNGAGSVFTTTVVTIVDVPVADLTASNSSPHDLGVTTDFTATISAGTNVTYTWDFGDGGSGDGLNPSHTYTDSGMYIVTVTAWNGRGFVTATTTVTVYDDPYNTLVGSYTANKTGAYLAEEIVYTFVLTNVGHLTHDDVIMSATLPIYTVLTGTVEGGGYVPPVLRPRGVKAAGADSGYVYWTGTMAPGESRTITYTVVVGWSIFMPGQKLMDTIGDAWLGTYLNYEQPVSVEMLPRYRVYLMMLTADNPVDSR